MPHRSWVDVLAEEPRGPLLERITRLIALFAIIAVGVAMYARLGTINSTHHADRVRTQTIICLAHPNATDRVLTKLCDSVLAEWRVQSAP